MDCKIFAPRFLPLFRALVTTGALLSGATGLAACGQKGPLQIPKTPAAAQRATLPQTVLGGNQPTTEADAPPPTSTATLPTPTPTLTPNNSPTLP